MIEPAKVCLFIPGHLKKFKLALFERIGTTIKAAGGQVIKGDIKALSVLPSDIAPIVGCTPELAPLIEAWRSTGRRWIYWDRGYARRVFATDLPTGADGGFYRWHVGAFQMQAVKPQPDDRWRALSTDVRPWQRTGRHIVVAEPSETYERFHGIEGWTAKTVKRLNELTDRPLLIRNKEMQRSGRKLHEDLKDAHCLVAHGSNAAVEAVIMGCPVFVHQDSAASLVGRCDLARIEAPLYPERQPWLNALAYSQFDERELVDGTLWRLLDGIG
ncbi:hypothetical protein [Mesorhizobium sp. M7A.F.Ce.TU.012.03.2.1]|uniref:hypothetical protein n=1 Tax=Mesorhizobium sp. M7A.F.Ce.TU.012.03.2.1 TaxID=2493681 RepID=UPI000FDBD78F|nr:hypothetical protein [Mesorhizobium sp. M7A.F.Ce.TU.012.03.2.1]AZV21471.1 hypothetical protein EJ079_21755 [Mesorhizobium sp. M7A.F.Ce.TU.012.03.2.1]